MHHFSNPYLIYQYNILHPSSISTGMSEKNIQQISEHLRRKLKDLRDRNSYKLAKKISAWFKAQKNNDNKTITNESIPDFFVGLHTTTVDIRKKLLEELERERAKVEEARLRQNQNDNLIAVLKNLLIDRGQQLKKMEKIMAIKSMDINLNSEKKQSQKQRESKTPQIQDLLQQVSQKTKQVLELKKQKSMLDEKNQQLEGRLREKENREEGLLAQIKKLKDRAKQRDPYYSGKGGAIPSPDKYTDVQSKTLYEHNQFGSLSEIPIGQNFTSLENTFSQQQSDRKVKSLASPRNMSMKGGDELWRLLHIQAVTLEQFLEVESEYQQQ